MLHLFSVTCTGETHDHFGKPDRNGNITFRYEGTIQGKRYVEVIPMKIISPTDIQSTSTVTVGGKLQSKFDPVVHRKS